MDSNNLTPLRKGVVGVQFLFVAFGATVLVPLLVGLDPSTALFTAGIGTLIFHAVTRGKVPIFLGSSFAFIAPIIKATELYGLAGTLSGMVGVALVYFVMSALVKWQGVRVIERLFPPVVIGPVIILIGLSLARNLHHRRQYGARSKYGEGELGAGLVVAGYGSRCLDESERTFEVDSYLLRYHCRLSGGMAFL